MVTALTVYGSSVAATTLTNAGQLSITTGGVEVGAASKIGTSTGYGEVTALGTANAWQALGALPAPTGLGWLLETTLAGQQIVAGTWTPIVSFKPIAASGTMTCDISVRAYIYDSVHLTYTPIGTMVMTGQSFTFNTKTTVTFTGTSLAAANFATGQKLYIDCWANVTANTLGITATIENHLSNSATAGVSGINQFTTPGYQPSLITKTTGLRTRVRTARTRSAGLRTRVRTARSPLVTLRTLVVTQVSRVSALRTKIRTQVNSTCALRIGVRNTPMAIQIAGALVPIDEETFKLSPRLDERWRCQFTVLDYAGTLSFAYDMAVLITDDTLGTLFTGFVVDDQVDPQTGYPSGMLLHQVDCIDNRHKADKRTANRLYSTPTYAGKMVVDMVDDALAAEGVSAPHVTAITSSVTDWAVGTLSSTVATTNLGDGDLELAGSGGATISASYLTQTAWNSGTLSLVQTNSDGTLSLIGAMRTWNDGKFGNQTLFGIADSSEKSSITQGVTSGQFWLTCPAGDESRSRQDWAGSWANGTFEADVYLTSNGPYWSMTYRTTNWTNTDNTYAYAVNLNTDTIILNRGPNGGTSSTAWTPLATVTFSPRLSTGWYRLRIIASGSSHKVYLNGVQKISVTDGTYTAAGMLALRNRNTQSTGSTKDYFDNFGILSALSGTWTSASTSISVAGTLLSSQISWDASLSTGGTVLVQISLDGGTTYQTCSNGGLIPGLTPGVSATGKSLIVKITLSTTSTVLLPKIKSLSWTVVGGGYAASGTRISAGLDLTPVGRAGASFLSWTQTLPSAATSVGMDISFDAVTWVDVTQQNGQAIPGIFSQPDPTVDSFSSDTSLNYSTPVGGSAATFTIDSANSRLVATGGSSAFYLNSTIVNADVDLLCDLDWADTGGLVWDFSDSSHYYLCTITDNQATSGAPSTLTLYKVNGGAPTQLGTSPLTFTRGMHHRLRATIQSGVITITASGVTRITYTDGSPLPAGLMGLYQSGNQTRYSQLWLQPLGDSLVGKMLYTRQRLASTDTTVTPQVQDLTIVVFSTSIDLGTLIPSADYRYTFIDKNYDDCAKQSNYSWFIDPNLLLHFHHRQAYPAPWILQSNTLALASDIIIDTNLLLEQASDLYRNRQILKGVINTGLFQDSFGGDTKRTSFSLSYKVAPGTIPSVSLNSVVQKVGLKGTTGNQWYYAEGDNTIAEDTSGTTLVSTDTLVVSYTGTFSDSIVLNNTDAQTALQAREGGSGIVEAVEDVSQKNMTYAAGLVYAQQLLTRYCVVDANNLPTGRTYTFTTRRNGLAIGQIVPVFVPEEGLTDVQMLITGIDITLQSQPNRTAVYEYLVTISELPVTASWAKLFASGLFD